MGEELNDGTRSEFYQVYLLPLDFNTYLKLKRDSSKALWPNLVAGISAWRLRVPVLNGMLIFP